MNMQSPIDVESLLLAQEAGLPRYTSYPPANHFRPEAGAAMEQPLLAAARHAASVSVYVHIPFCDRMCWFCGCHTKQVARYEPVEEYIQTLCGEIALWGRKLGVRPNLSALHFGGGSPSLLRPQEWQAMHRALHEVFAFTPEAEVAVELDPSDANPQLIESIAAFGVNRVSIGVQDFDPAVQKAINRPQTFEQTRDVVAALRQAGIASINIDALYGLPLQDETRLAATLGKVISLAPDRVALFGYAHVPWLKTHQKMINDRDLPDTKARIRQALLGRQLLLAQGYQQIGIDHFAKPGDSLATAAASGRLMRNFQGYTTDTATVRIGLGASAIGAFPDGLVQNEVAAGAYARSVHNGLLPMSRGITLTADDQIRAYIISALMCNFEISFAELEARFGALAAPLIAEARAIAAGEARRLCAADAGKLRVLGDAPLFARIVASKFDAYLKTAEKRYSKAV